MNAGLLSLLRIQIQLWSNDVSEMYRIWCSVYYDRRIECPLFSENLGLNINTHILWHHFGVSLVLWGQLELTTALFKWPSTAVKYGTVRIDFTEKNH